MGSLIYAVCFGVGLLFAIVSAFLGHLFGGHDVHVDVGTGGHAEAGFQETGMPGLSPFSPTTITSFLTAFGGLGMVFTKIEATHRPWISGAAGALWGFDDRRRGGLAFRHGLSQGGQFKRIARG